MSNLEQAMKQLAATLTGQSIDIIPSGSVEEICIWIAEHYTGGGTGEVSVDNLSGATDIGKKLMKAQDASAARNAIGAGAPYTLPEAGANIGGVKKAAAVEFTADSATAETCAAAITTLITNLKAAGIMA